MNRVLCDATVEMAGSDLGGQNEKFMVTVKGRMDHDGIERTYVVSAQTQDEAARDGIKRFVDEMGGAA